MTGSEAVVARIFVEGRCEDAVGQEVLGGCADSGGAETLTVGAAVSPIVRGGVCHLFISGRGEPADSGKR